MQRFPNLLLDDGNQIYFGQNLEELEVQFGIPAVDHPLTNHPQFIARKGIDRRISTSGLTLEFDTGRLKSIEFSNGYQFKNTLAPYAESWKNFEIIGNHRIKAGMNRDEFVAYLEAWEVRAKNLCAESIELDDVKENQYRFGFCKDEFSEMFSSILGPSRRAGGGGIWADGWVAFFSMPTEAEIKSGTVIELRSLSAFCDEFNTVARRKS